MANKDFITDIDEQKQRKKLDRVKEQKFKQKIQATKDVERAVVQSGDKVVDAIEKKVEDTAGLIRSVEALGRVIAGNDETTREELSERLSAINKTLGIDQSKDNTSKVVDAIKNLQKSVTKKEKVTVSNLDDLADFFFSLEMAINNLKLDPQIDVKAPDVTVEAPKIDFKPIIKAIKDMPKAEVPDNEDVIKKLRAINTTLEKILTRPIPVGSGGASGGSGGTTPLDGVEYDYVDVQQTDSDTETYVYKSGGASGTVQKTIVVNYTSSTKDDIDNVSWS